MVTATSMRKPNYFLVVFGAGRPYPPEGGVYPLPGGGGYITREGVSVGDVLLLWESLGFAGVGVVTRTETVGEGEGIYYQYFPLCHPVHWRSLDAARKTIPKLRTPLNRPVNFIQKICSTCFRAAIAGRQIDWP
jgi:hypothetical protein